MKKLIYLCMAVMMAGMLLVGCGTKTQTDGSEEGTGMFSPETLMSGLHHVEIEVQDYGTISVELDADHAPISVTNFITLAKDGFYDGLTFHRIISGFMIQGGDPMGDGTGGSEQTIKGEFSENGVENPLTHTRGAISMARTRIPDSASSQFFIVQEDQAPLDGKYAVFGYVTDGMDIVDRICEDAIVQDNNGTVYKEDQPVITAVRVID
ncbi:MAG: peptidylprolyl isomerase [Lachnospiraceae bacterium]|nr:peptidylprolyl isomerase [Lachnospiraceae bacterium]